MPTMTFVFRFPFPLSELIACLKVVGILLIVQEMPNMITRLSHIDNLSCMVRL